MGCLRAAAGCLIAIAVLAAIAVFAGTALLRTVLPGAANLIQQAVPAVRTYAELSRKLQAAVPGSPAVSTSVNVTNGRATLTVNATIPFDPTADPVRARVLANRLAAIVRAEAPRDLRPDRLEVILQHDASRARQHFTYSLGAAPAPAPAAPPKPAAPAGRPS